MSLQETDARIKELLQNIADTSELEKVRVELFGKNGIINTVRREIVNVPKEEKKDFGQKVNALKNFAEDLFQEKKEFIEKRELDKKLESEKIDISLPGRYVRKGTIHPLTSVLQELCEVFKAYGFSVEDGPEIESEDYNFDKLNIPPEHPARAMQDTFFMPDGHVLRTHTSPVQIRTMLNSKPPIKIVAPGRVYRKDDVDATHSPVFHQIEGLYIAENVTFADLKGVIMGFLKDYYGKDTKVKFQPSYFPFTEPSAEVYITCNSCKGEGGCPVCKDTGYIEILGCGMVHPDVLEKCGIDSEKYSGFAFGIGIERVAMLKYGIKDMRYLYENDQRFLNNF